jgi:hypothetical protein
MINLFNWVTTLVDSFTFYGGGGKGDGGGGGSSQPVDFFGRGARKPYEELLNDLIFGGRVGDTADTYVNSRGRTVRAGTRGAILVPGKPGVSVGEFIRSQPGYQFGYDQGLEGLNRQFASTGTSFGGNQAIALQNFGNKYAGDYYNNMVSNLMSASGATMGAGQSSVQNPQMGSSPFGQILGAGLGAANLFRSLPTAGVTFSGLFSDRNLKRNIKLVDVVQGYKIYTYKYIWSNEEYRGVMAQDILETDKDAVTMNKNGYYMVDYSKLGV